MTVEGVGEFDAFVAAPLRQNAGRFATAAGAALEHWRTSRGGEGVAPISQAGLGTEQKLHV